jgi:hypothetical protein
MNIVELHVERRRLWVTDSRERTIAETAYETCEDLLRAVEGLAGGLPGSSGHSRTKLRIVLYPPVVQTRVLDDLPLLRQSDLRALVAEQAPQFFRGRRESLITNACWVSARGKKIARVAAAERSMLQTLIKAARDSGFVLETVGTRIDGLWLELLPEEERIKSRQSALRRLGMQAGLISVIWFASAGWYLVGLRMQQGRLDRELSRLRPATVALNRLDQDARAASKMIKAVQASREDRTRILLELHSVVLALPDSAYLTTLSFSVEGPGSMTGLARRPFEVLGTLRSQGTLIDPQLRKATPHIASAQVPWGEFTIQFGGSTK